MKLIKCFLSFIPFASLGQNLELGVGGGIANYQGDLQPAVFTFTGAKPAAEIFLKYHFTPNFSAYSSFTSALVYAADANNSNNLRPRNLSFYSKLQEFQLGVAYKMFNPEKFPVSPYCFVGVGAFAFNPYTYTADGQKVKLQPLGTEGQGLAQYPDKKPYKRLEIAIPYGGGLQWQANCNVNFGFKFQQTKTFTDYLDDVSDSYVRAEELAAAKGQIAVDLAWRGDEYNGRPYPTTSFSGRGNPKVKDWYYFLEFTVGVKVINCETGTPFWDGFLESIGLKSKTSGGSYYKKMQKKQLRCP